MKQASEKLKKWTKKEVSNVTMVYVINVFIMSFIFAFFKLAALDMNLSAMLDYLSNPQTVLTFFLLACLSALLMLAYFLLADRDFLHQATNSEMVFLIIELSFSSWLYSM